MGVRRCYQISSVITGASGPLLQVAWDHGRAGDRCCDVADSFPDEVREEKQETPDPELGREEMNRVADRQIRALDGNSPPGEPAFVRGLARVRGRKADHRDSDRAAPALSAVAVPDVRSCASAISAQRTSSASSGEVFGAAHAASIRASASA